MDVQLPRRLLASPAVGSFTGNAKYETRETVEVSLNGHVGTRTPGPTNLTSRDIPVPGQPLLLHSVIPPQ